MWPTDPELGPLLSAVIFLLLLCIVFLAATVPFSAVLGSDAGVTAGVIATLAGLMSLAIKARGRLGDRDRER